MQTMEKKLALGVDLGATTVKTGLVTDDGAILAQTKLPSRGEKGPEAVVAQIETSIRDILRHEKANHICGIGIGSPGIVDENGVVHSAPNFSDWTSVALRTSIQEIFRDHPVKIENDANVAAIAESKFGAGKNITHFLFVIWGTGVGGGIILDRGIYRGSTGGAGEIGHVCIDYNGPPCNCGSNGCVEAYIGQRYLSRRTAERVKSYPSSKILELVAGRTSDIEPLIIAQAAHQGDQTAREILTEAGTLLGVAIAGVMNTFDLRVSIIGGGVSLAGELVMDAILSSVRRRVMEPLRKDVQVLPAQLGNNAGILGAAGLVL